MWHLHLSHKLTKWVTLETVEQRTHVKRTTFFLDTFCECLVSPHQDFSVLKDSLQPGTRRVSEHKQKPADSTPQTHCVQLHYLLYKKKNPQAEIPKDLFLVFPKELFSFAEEKQRHTGERLIRREWESPGASLHHVITIFISLVSFMVICSAPNFHLTVFEPFLGCGFPLPGGLQAISTI